MLPVRREFANWRRSHQFGGVRHVVANIQLVIVLQLERRRCPRFVVELRTEGRTFRSVEFDASHQTSSR